MLSNPVTGYEDIQLNTFLNTQLSNTRNVIDFWQEGNSTAASPWSVNFSPYNSGAGSSIAINTADLTAPPGIITCATGTTASGAAGFNSAFGGVLLASGAFNYQVRFLVPDLSDATDTYTLRFGVGATFTVSGDITNGVYAEYTHSLTNSAFRLRAANAGVRNSVSGLTPLSAGVYHWLEILYDALTATTTLYLDNALEATLTSGYPAITSTMQIGCGQIIKSAGVTSRSVIVDALFYGHAFAAAR